jgi:hypothetical protein
MGATTPTVLVGKVVHDNIVTTVTLGMFAIGNSRAALGARVAFVRRATASGLLPRDT